jgi:hypothetical protein
MFHESFIQQIENCNFQENVLSMLSINEMQILKLISPQERENNDDQNTFGAHERASDREFLECGIAIAAGCKR